MKRLQRQKNNALLLKLKRPQKLKNNALRQKNKQNSKKKLVSNSSKRMKRTRNNKLSSKPRPSLMLKLRFNKFKPLAQTTQPPHFSIHQAVTSQLQVLSLHLNHHPNVAHVWVGYLVKLLPIILYQPHPSAYCIFPPCHFTSPPRSFSWLFSCRFQSDINHITSLWYSWCERLW